MTARPSDPHIGVVVEGRGDAEAVPLVLRRYFESQAEYRDLLGKAIPTRGRSRALVTDGLEGYVGAAANRPGCRGVLVVFDSDKDPACELGPAIRSRAAACTGKPVIVVLAESSFESWLMSSAETLDLGLSFPVAGSAAKVIETAMGVKYVKPVYQPKLAHKLDLALARERSTSFRRLLTKADELRNLM